MGIGDFFEIPYSIFSNFLFFIFPFAIFYFIFSISDFLSALPTSALEE